MRDGQHIVIDQGCQQTNCQVKESRIDGNFQNLQTRSGAEQIRTGEKWSEMDKLDGKLGRKMLQDVHCAESSAWTALICLHRCPHHSFIGTHTIHYQDLGMEHERTDTEPGT